MNDPIIAFNSIPNIRLMNGKPPFGCPEGKAFESFTVTQGNHNFSYCEIPRRLGGERKIRVWKPLPKRTRFVKEFHYFHYNIKIKRIW